MASCGSTSGPAGTANTAPRSRYPPQRNQRFHRGPRGEPTPCSSSAPRPRRPPHPRTTTTSRPTRPPSAPTAAARPADHRWGGRPPGGRPTSFFRKEKIRDALRRQRVLRRARQPAVTTPEQTADTERFRERAAPDQAGSVRCWPCASLGRDGGDRRGTGMWPDQVLCSWAPAFLSFLDHALRPQVALSPAFVDQS